MGASIGFGLLFEGIEIKSNRGWSTEHRRSA